MGGEVAHPVSSTSGIQPIISKKALIPISFDIITDLQHQIEKKQFVNSFSTGNPNHERSWEYRGAIH